jgi:hypothetical protein
LKGGEERYRILIGQERRERRGFKIEPRLVIGQEIRRGEEDRLEVLRLFYWLRD